MNQQERTRRCCPRILKELDLEASDILIRGSILVLCETWGITDPKLESTKIYGDDRELTNVEIAELEELDAREAEEYRKQTGRDLNADLELLKLLGTTFSRN